MKHTVLLGFCLGILVFAGCNNPQKGKEATKNANETPAVPPDMHTSQIALDYHGTYKGVLPCADCAGIETIITLKEGDEFELAMKYLGKSDVVFRETGNFSWNENGRVILLEGLENRAAQYQVGENRLFQLDREGNRISSNLAEKYILEKTD